jgi:hypothetical protein
VEQLVEWFVLTAGPSRLAPLGTLGTKVRDGACHRVCLGDEPTDGFMSYPGGVEVADGYRGGDRLGESRDEPQSGALRRRRLSRVAPYTPWAD